METATPPPAPSDAGGLDPPGSNRGPVRRRPVGWALGVAAAFLVLVGLLGVLPEPDPSVEPPPQGVLAGPPAQHVFSTSTGMILIIDAGADGLVTVDLDHGVARRSSVEGQIDDDRLTEVGDRLVLATTSHPVSVPLDLDETPRPLGGEPTDQFVPAGRADRLWLLAGTAAAGGRAVQADLSGDVTEVVPSATWPAGVAIPAALTDRLLTVAPGRAEPLGWLRSGGNTIEPIADRSLCASPVAQRGATIIVGAGAPTCDGVVRLGPAGPVPPVVTIPELRQLVVRAVSPAGNRLVVTGLDTQGHDGGTWLVDFDSSPARLLAELPPAASSVVAWSQDGQRLFVVATEDQKTSLALYDTRSDRFEQHELPLDPVRGTTTALETPTTDALVVIPASVGPALPSTRAACVSPVADPRDGHPPSAIGPTPCLLPKADDAAPEVRVGGG